MATIAYKWPVTGSVAPTAAQMFGHNTLVALVTPDLYDTTITITHNMNLSAADLAAFFPEVDITARAVQEESSTPFISSKTANTVVITVSDLITNFDDAFTITIRRPQSKFK